jgi:hypothetical protein
MRRRVEAVARLRTDVLGLDTVEEIDALERARGGKWRQSERLLEDETVIRDPRLTDVGTEPRHGDRCNCVVCDLRRDLAGAVRCRECGSWFAPCESDRVDGEGRPIAATRCPQCGGLAREAGE